MRNVEHQTQMKVDDAVYHTTNGIDSNWKLTSSENDPVTAFKVRDRLSVNSMEDKLYLWANKHNVSQVAIKELLIILKDVNSLSHRPSDARTLMKTPRSKATNIIRNNGWNLAHLGFGKGLIASIQKYYSKHYPKQINVNVNIDGLPLCKSSSTQFWPILGSIVDNFYT